MRDSAEEYLTLNQLNVESDFGTETINSTFNAA